jgi:sulfofructose kinase
VAIDIDVLCAGLACYDLIFSVGRHPGPDEKVFAGEFFDCGGGPAANAAVAAARLGARSAFAGYLGNDLFGQRHLEELLRAGVLTDLVVIGDAPTPLSTIIVKPDGRRTVIGYKGAAPPLSVDFAAADKFRPRVMLFDGHQQQLSQRLAEQARRSGALTVLDAGSLHAGTRLLAGVVDYVVASEKFARQFSGQKDVFIAAGQLRRPGTTVVITQGAAGLAWQSGTDSGRLPAFEIDALDTTGAGDAFHGAFAAGLAAGMPWQPLLRYARAAAALCCAKFGARLGMPTASEVSGFLERHP